MNYKKMSNCLFEKILCGRIAKQHYIWIGIMGGSLVWKVGGQTNGNGSR